MKRIDALIFKDIVGPWLFGVGLFAGLIMAATYLGRLAGFIVEGVPPSVVGELTALYFPAVLVKTFSMAALLAGLLAFGRLSSDSEIVALRACGASIFRYVAPVIVLSAAVALLTFGFGEYVMPAATAKSEQIATQIARNLHPSGAQPFSQSIVEHEKLVAEVIAENVNMADQELEGVTVVAYDKGGQVSNLMFADTVGFSGPMPTEQNWEARGNVRVVPTAFLFNPSSGAQVIHFNDGIWPADIPRPAEAFHQFASEGPDDPDSESMAQLRAAISYHRLEGDRTPEQIRNLEYGYWNKIAFPLAAITFGALGAVLGIRSHRTGTAAGMALAIAIIFANVSLANFMNIWAMKAIIPAWCGSFAPLAIGALACGVIMWRRNG